MMPLDQDSVNIVIVGGAGPRRFRRGLKDRGGCSAHRGDVRVVPRGARAVPAIRRQALLAESDPTLPLHSSAGCREVPPALSSDAPRPFDVLPELLSSP